MILLLAAPTDLAPDDAVRGGTARYRLFDFFAGEVMEKMDPSDAASLMRIAFLPSATAAMAVAISGELRAGDLLAAHGHGDAAIAQLIDAAAWDEALALIVAHAGRFVAQGRTAVIRGWILALPEASRDNPQAWYWLRYCELAADPAQALQHLERVQRGFAIQGSDDGSMRGSFYTAAAAADAIIFLGSSFDAIEPWMQVLKAHAPAYLGQRDVDTDLRVLPGLLAAFVHRDTAHPLTATIADLSERMLDQPLGASQRILLGTLAYYLLWTGQTLRLDRIIIKIDRLCAEPDAAPATLLRWYGVGVLIRSLLGRVDEALHHARRALTLAGPGPAPMRAKAHLLMVLAAVAARDAELARTHLTEAAGAIDPGNAIDATTYEFQRGLLMLLDGDWRNAAKLMGSAVTSARASGWPLREHIALLGQALAATQVGAHDEAEAALHAALTHGFYAVCRWHHWIAALVEAHLAERRGDRTRCLDALSRAFKVGREGGYDFGPMPYCCGDMMSHLAALAFDHDIDTLFAQGIVRRYALPAPSGASERWPWPIRVRTLGRFVIELGGVSAAAPRKEIRKPLDLLKLLVALGAPGGGAVPVARLCAALWPDAEGDAARNSFDNALHRLRKLLGGERHMQLRAGALSLDATTCWTDLAALEACLDEVDALVPGADSAQVSALAERALALYVGEFLAGEEDLSDVLVARARLQARFARQMGALGARLEAAGQYAAAVLVYARVVEQQPLAEDIHRRLIACLIALGQRAEAYEVYRRCRQQLSVVLGLRPAAETKALVAPLRNL